MKIVTVPQIDGNLMRFLSPVFSMVLGNLVTLLVSLVQLLSMSDGCILVVTSMGLLPKEVTVASHLIEGGLVHIPTSVLFQLLDVHLDSGVNDVVVI